LIAMDAEDHGEILVPASFCVLASLRERSIPMPDGFVRIRSGEKQPVYGQAVIDSGTLTIQASPAPACTLYDSTGTAAPGFNNIGVTGYDSGALASPRAWLNLDTTGLLAGYYTLVFKFTANGSDSITRVYEPSIEVQIVDVRT